MYENRLNWAWSQVNCMFTNKGMAHFPIFALVLIFCLHVFFCIVHFNRLWLVRSSDKSVTERWYRKSSSWLKQTRPLALLQLFKSGLWALDLYKRELGASLILLWIIEGGCRPVLCILTLFQTRFYFHTRFKTWPLKSIPVFKPGGSHKTQHTWLRRQKLDHHYLDESANKKNIFLKIYLEFAHYGFMLFTGWEVRIVRNCARGLEYRPKP